jgi:hypothetical protein
MDTVRQRILVLLDGRIIIAVVLAPHAITAAQFEADP